MHARPLRDHVTASAAYPLAGRARARPVRRLVRDLPALRGRRPATPRPGCGRAGRSHRAEAAAGHRRHGLRRRLPHAGPPDRPGQPQGPQQHPRRRRARPRLALRHRLGRGRPRRDPPRPRRLRRLRPVRRRGASGSGSRWRSTWPCRRHPTTPGSTTHPELFTTRADGSIAYAENPPKKYQDIYPLNFDNDPERRLRRGAPGHPGVDRPRRQDLPRRQPAHQAGGVLAVADRRRRRRPPRGDLAGRGVHPARR